MGLFGSNKKLKERLKRKDQEIQRLRIEQNRLLKQLEEKNTGQVHKRVSIERIQDFVNKLMDNENINIRFIPDAAEKKLYKNILNMMLSILNEIMNETKVEIMGHNIQFQLSPN